MNKVFAFAVAMAVSFGYFHMTSESAVAELAQAGYGPAAIQVASR